MLVAAGGSRAGSQGPTGTALPGASSSSAQDAAPSRRVLQGREWDGS